MADVPVLRPLCDVEIVLREGAPIPIGQSPWTARRVSDIAGGTFSGARPKGTVEPSGADRSQSSVTAEGVHMTAPRFT